MSEEVKKNFVIQKIYTRNVSFESPNTPSVFISELQPELSIDLKIESKLLENSIYHIVVRVTAATKIKENTVFLCEVEQAGIFTLTGFTETEVGYILGVQCPNILFPYAREVISGLVTRGGFPQFLLEPVNFESMYHGHIQKAESEAITATDK